MEHGLPAEWLVDSIRATFIANSQVASEGRRWWNTVIGTDPEIVSSKPSARESTESGLFLDGHLEIKSTFNRVDWIYSPILNQPNAIPTLGSIEEVFHKLTPYIEKWLAIDSTDYVRLAFSPSVMYATESREQSNKKITEYLPFLTVDPASVTDLLIQVNFPSQSETIPALPINRICKLMSVAAQFVNMSAGIPIPTVQTSYFCRAELDVNTSPENMQIIPKNNQFALFQELTNIAQELLTKGKIS